MAWALDSRLICIPVAGPSLTSNLTLAHSDLPKDSIFSFIKWGNNRTSLSYRIIVRIKYDLTYSMNERDDDDDHAANQKATYAR